MTRCEATTLTGFHTQADPPQATVQGCRLPAKHTGFHMTLVGNKTWQWTVDPICGATNGDHVCTNPPDHTGNHYDEATEHTWATDTPAAALHTLAKLHASDFYTRSPHRCAECGKPFPCPTATILAAAIP